MSTQNNNTLVGDVMLTPEHFPIISKRTILKETLEQMDDFKLGIACLINDDQQLLAVLTDGDIRRKLLSVQKPLSALFVDDALVYAITQPITTTSETLLIDAVNLMGKKRVWDLPVVNNNVLVGLLHLHQAIKKIIN